MPTGWLADLPGFPSPVPSQPTDPADAGTGETAMPPIKHEGESMHEAVERRRRERTEVGRADDELQHVLGTAQMSFEDLTTSPYGGTTTDTEYLQVSVIQLAKLLRAAAASELHRTAYAIAKPFDSSGQWFKAIEHATLRMHERGNELHPASAVDLADPNA